jgi:hypothetical protein
MRSSRALRYHPRPPRGHRTISTAPLLRPGRWPRSGYRPAAGAAGDGRTTRWALLRPAALVEAAILLMAGAALVLLLTGELVGQAPSRQRGPSTAHSARGLSPGVLPGRSEVLPSGGRWVPAGLSAWTNALLDDPRQAATVLAGTGDGLWVSTDGGATWRRDGSGLGGATVLALTGSPATGTVIAGTEDGAVYAGARRRHGVRRRRIGPRLGPDHPIVSITVSPRDGQTVLAGTFGALYRGSTTGGPWTWQRVAQTGDSAITSLTWAPWQPHLAFASVFAGAPAVLVSRDDGRTWRADTAGLPSALPTATLRAFIDRTPRVILSTMGAGVWLRASTGVWRDISTGLPARHAMDVIAVSSNSSTLLYAGTMGFGVYAKQGTWPWRRLGHGLSGSSYTILSLAMTAGPQPRLLAATARGVFRYVPPS